ncbi:MAG TPA: MipA/OmpV family protein [Burkholderiales bacterium]|nr:MipA/OmpV family protein [Burkholderiales bacterium]HYA46788.1 MipA/OmpV family protein [Burkholderiales bacterium]
MRSALLFLLLAPLAATAQMQAPDYNWLGAGVRTRPAYDGSAAHETELIPSVRYFGKPWFARTTQGMLEGGARLEVNASLHLGAQIAYEGGRKSSEAEFLASRNVPDISPGASAGVHAEWDSHLGPAPTTLLARVRQFVDTDRGSQGDLRYTVGVFGGAVSAALFFQGTWASAKSNRSFYGVTTDVSASTGLPAYIPGGGLLYTTGGLLWEVDLSSSWIVVGNLEARLLHGAAAGSPLVERATSRYASASLAYRWR